MSENEQDVMRHGAHLLLAANLPDAPDDDDQWPKYGQLYPHVIASNAIECEDSAVRELVFNQTEYLFHWGEHEASREMAQQVYDVWLARIGPDHPDTLKMGRWLGFMLWTVGQFREAAALFRRALAVHPHLTSANHNLAAALSEAVKGNGH